MSWYEAAKIIVLSLSPPNCALALMVAGLLVHGSPRLSKTLGWTGAGLYLLLALPVTTGWLLDAFDRSELIQPAALASVGAIVIPGGGTTMENAEFASPAVGSLTVERIRYGALLSRRSGIPVLVTGGTADPDLEPESLLITRVLTDEFGITPGWVEATSRDTRENAQESYRMLSAQGITRIALVVNRIEMPRAVAEYRAAGFDVVPAPTGMPNRVRERELGDWLPSLGGLQRSSLLFYEGVGILARRVLRIERPS